MKEAAIEILIYKPDSENPLPEEQRGVVVNPHLKERFKQFLPIGVYLDGSELKYYFFDQCDSVTKFYRSLNKLKKDLSNELYNIFENNPKLFIMGHANGGYYGLGNSGELFHDEKFDALLNDFKQSLSEQHEDIFVTLESCNTDSQLDAAKVQQEKTFLERVSINHPEITFGGTGPWDAQDAETGFLSLAPEAPITSMAGNVWKAGNRVIFFHDGVQFVVKKSLFASTQTAKELKINTIEYARAILGEDINEELIKEIALHRDILKIEDLKKIAGFQGFQIEGEKVNKFFEQEQQIIRIEQENYFTRVGDILNRVEPIEQLTNRDVVLLLLGLKEPSVFKDNEYLLDSILSNEALLGLEMVSCGKVLIGGPSNNSVIDLLLEHGADINSVDAKGLTALHYAVQNFYNYRKEPLNLIKKLLDCGASVAVKDNQGKTPVDTAQEHSEDERVTASDKLIASLTKCNSKLTPLNIKQSVRNIFQMSQHIAQQLRSLREYSKCSGGTLYLPENVINKLEKILKSAKGSDGLLSEFEKELKSIINDLKEGRDTGIVFDYEDEEIPKRFSDPEEKLQPVMDKLVRIKEEVLSTKTETTDHCKITLF